MASPIDPVSLQSALAAWFGRHGRRLAFRETRDPWSVLVSEVMLQQTQVTRVEPAWEAFIGAFPTPAALAAAVPADAVRAWAGLGYNRRALNLWRCATVLVERHGGAVPGTLEELIALPGIGPYTARAVAAIAFGLSVAAVDTNVRRVVSRVSWGSAAAGDVQSAADALVDPAAPDRWTHAVMDLGATTCRPRTPHCELCPLQPMCTFAVGWPELPRTAERSRTTTAVPFERTSRWLRGRIVASLRGASPGAWIRFDLPIGEHSTAAVQTAINALVSEGLAERSTDGAIRLPERASAAA